MKKKYSVLITSIVIFLILIGISLILTVIFRVWGDSLAQGEYQGIFFGGSIAMFIGLFLVLIKGFKSVHTIVASALCLILLMGAYNISVITNILNGNALSLSRNTLAYAIIIILFILVIKYYLKFGKK